MMNPPQAEKGQVLEMKSRNDRARGLYPLVAAAATYFLVLSALACWGTDVTQASPPSALAARTISLNETGNLHLTSKHGFTLNEQGARPSGTVAATIYVHLRIVSTRRVTAEVNIYPNGGSISGYGQRKLPPPRGDRQLLRHVVVNRGTGSYNHAQGSGLSFSGTISESN